MKSFTTLLLTSLLPSLLNASPLSLSPRSLTSSNWGAPNTFVKALGPAFVLNDHPFYYSGSNCYYLFYANQTDIDNLFAAANTIQAKSIRTWLWSDGGGALSSAWNNTNVSLQGQVWFQERNKATGQVVYNDDPINGLGHFDYVIQSAKAHNVKLIVPLTGNWGAFGGIDWYVNRFGGTYHSDFFSNDDMIAAYKNYMSHVLNHVNHLSGVAYKDEPTIMGFELVNEPRCQGSTYPANPSCDDGLLSNWIGLVSEYFKSIDKNHMLGLGDEGYFDRPNGPGYTGAYSNLWDGSSGNNFVGNLQIPQIDFGTFHSYFDSWDTPNDPLWLNNTLTWISDHAKTSFQVGKPVIIEEYGTTNKTQRKLDFPTVQKQIEKTFLAGSNYWMLASTYDGALYPDYDGYTIYANDPDIQNLVINHANVMNSRDNFP